MKNNQSAKIHEITRRMLVITIIVLLLLIVTLIIHMLSIKACTNPERTGMLTTNAPSRVSPSPAKKKSPLDFSASPTPLRSIEPSSMPTPEPTPIQTKYGIACVVTEGSMDDTLARLEQLKNLPSSETLILLDVGHGGFDPGTVGLDTGITEADLNLQISRRVAEKLGEKGYFVFMTRMGDYACAENKDADMSLRKRIMRLDIFDAAVSIHQNSLGEEDRSAHGIRLYHYKAASAGAKYALDERLAKNILESICAMTDEQRTHTDTGNLMVCREPHAPAALVECGFLSNAADEKKLSDSAYQETFAQAVANGIENFLNGAD